MYQKLREENFMKNESIRAWNNDLHAAVVIEGKYKGREGRTTKVNSYGNVMFYSKEGCYPYRVCLKKEQIQYQ